jgi:hypothetical protein
MEGSGILWLLATVAGVAILGLAFAYGISRNRGLPPAPRNEAGNGLQPTRLPEDGQTQVRQGSREGVVSPILVISLGLVVVGMIAAFVLAV